MDKEKARRLVEEYSKLVIQNMIVNKIILYGSYARGDYRQDSDIDVAVIVPRSSISKDILEDMSKLFKLRRNISTDIEPVLLIDEEDTSGFLESILEYGDIVYSNWFFKRFMAYKIICVTIKNKPSYDKKYHRKVLNMTKDSILAILFLFVQCNTFFDVMIIFLR